MTEPSGIIPVNKAASEVTAGPGASVRPAKPQGAPLLAAGSAGILNPALLRVLERLPLGLVVEGVLRKPYNMAQPPILIRRALDA